MRIYATKRKIDFKSMWNRVLEEVAHHPIAIRLSIASQMCASEIAKVLNFSVCDVAISKKVVGLWS